MYIVHACVTHTFSVVSIPFAHAEGATVVTLLLSLTPHNGAERINNNYRKPTIMNYRLYYGLRGNMNLWRN